MDIGSGLAVLGCWLATGIYNHSECSTDQGSWLNIIISVSFTIFFSLR